MKKQLSYFLFFLILSVLLISCKFGSDESPEYQMDTIAEQDSIQSLEIITNTEEVVMDTLKKVYDNPEVQEAHVAIVKKYGEQWDFCKCIIKSDSVNTALMEADDDEFDLVMERSNFIDNKCKGLLIQPNATPEDRYKHENKVKKCLKSAKK